LYSSGRHHTTWRARRIASSTSPAPLNLKQSVQKWTCITKPIETPLYPASYFCQFSGIMHVHAASAGN
jgi:hypothetical protein